MNDDSTQAILEEIDATLAAIGQPDYDAFRALLARASVLLHNVALLSARFAVPSREELVRFIQEMPPDEREQKLRLLVGMRQYLPTIGKTVIAATERVFPKPQGGAPSKFKDRDAIRQACELIMSFMRSGQSESVAKKSAAKKLKVSHSTIDRAWKRNGGLRDIYHPARQLKLLQRWVTKKILPRIPVSLAAAAYEQRCSIASNAKKHVEGRFLLRLDFSEFFPSLTAGDVKRLIVQNAAQLRDFVNDDKDADIISKITCRFGALTIGAPSSPPLSNRIMEPFDAYWLSFSSDRGVIYTRYADDLFFSCSEPNRLQEFPAAILAYLARQNGPVLRLNVGKTIFSSKKGRRVVTGLKLTSDYKVFLGRDLKRAIRTRVHLGVQDLLTSEDLVSLRGLLAFAKDVEPDIVVRLQAKYGAHRVNGLLK